MNQNQQPMNPDEIAASLAFATHLSEQMMPKDAPQSPQNAPQSSQNAPEQSQTPQTQETAPPDQSEAKFKEMEGKMDTMKAEMEAMLKGEISSVKDIIIEALKEDQKEDGTNS